MTEYSRHPSGISAATISRIERGHAMDAATLLRLWAYLLQPESRE